MYESTNDELQTESKTVNVYVPADNESIFCVVAPFDQLKLNEPDPLINVEIDPSLSPVHVGSIPLKVMFVGGASVILNVVES